METRFIFFILGVIVVFSPISLLAQLTQVTEVAGEVTVTADLIVEGNANSDADLGFRATWW